MGEAIFNKIIESPSGVLLAKPDIKDHWKLMRTKDKKVHLYIPEMIDWLTNLPETGRKIEEKEALFPFNLIAGERRNYNANTVIRDPKWRKADKEGALKINPNDAQKLGIEDGDTVKCENAVGSIQIIARIGEEVPEGILSMPNGFGLQYDDQTDYREIGALSNMLTNAHDCDPMAKTPYHKKRARKIGEGCSTSVEVFTQATRYDNTNIRSLTVENQLSNHQRKNT